MKLYSFGAFLATAVATLGLTSFRFITDYLKQGDLLPGFVDGYSKIHRDETRHIGYGVWFLRETIRAQPDQADTVRSTWAGLTVSSRWWCLAILTAPRVNGGKP